jgi:hypothetical protein
MMKYPIPEGYEELKEKTIMEKDDVLFYFTENEVVEIFPWFVGKPYRRLRGIVTIRKKDKPRSKSVNTSDRSTLRRWIDTAWYNNARCLRVRTYHQSRRWARMAVKWEHDLKELDNA